MPKFNPYVSLMLSSYVNLNWLIGAQDRKQSANDSTSPTTVATDLKKQLECAFRSFLDNY